MNFGRINLVAGAFGLLLCAVGGLALGMTFEAHSVKAGEHVLSLARFYLREGHSHGMPVAILNLVVALVVDRLALSDGQKRACSWLTVGAFVLPIGLAAKGAAGAASTFPPIGMIGVLAFLGAVILLAMGARRAS